MVFCYENLEVNFNGELSMPLLKTSLEVAGCISGNLSKS